MWAKLHADKGCDYDHLRQWLRTRHIVPRIARRGIQSSARPGRHRRAVERTVSRLGGFRRLHRRYEYKPEPFLAFAAPTRQRPLAGESTSSSKMDCQDTNGSHGLEDLVHWRGELVDLVEAARHADASATALVDRAAIAAVLEKAASGQVGPA